MLDALQVLDPGKGWNKASWEAAAWQQSGAGVVGAKLAGFGRLWAMNWATQNSLPSACPWPGPLNCH